MRKGLFVGLTAASVGVVYGYDLSTIAGVLLFVGKDLAIASDSQKGLLTTMVVIGQIGGALGAGVLANAIGRKRSMLLILLGYTAFALLGAFSMSVPMLLTARALIGVAIGVSVVVAPVYVAESAPAAVRGSMLTAYQVATLSGVILGYVTAYFLAGSQSWRLMLGLAAVPALLLLPLLLRMPESARWYLLKGRTDDARRSLLRIEPEDNVDAELAEISRAIAEETQDRSGGGLSELVRQPYLRATLFVVALGFLQQITGINAIIYFSPGLFTAMGFHGNFALLALPAMVQVAGLAAALSVSLFLIDRMGRRPILMSGIALMTIADIVLVAVFANGAAHAGGLALVFGFGGVLLFIIGFNFGFGSLVWVYAGESFPSRLRSIGSSVMLTANLTGNALIAAFFLPMLQILGGAGVYTVFGLLAVVALVVVYRFAPETKGRQLEEIRRYWENGGKWPTPLDTPDTSDAP
ncbi:sugar porter family MFS transporter [Mycobacterium bourgelatii]|uniref:MFS transporter n=1 Tax=Mycobacterium bourgelatii TaxID=1273442 RepID=A0A7I9YJY0_MYCBU|nr:sugar porter family MFS transporter [Mycobacterium bourgelatii]MCV6973584.1 sugar porter family MFS transporter [Mycobacterium bourgelatii]GFG88842.1 MFS transporter [Mycobacterium bourgelatii]